MANENFITAQQQARLDLCHSDPAAKKAALNAILSEIEKLPDLADQFFMIGIMQDMAKNQYSPELANSRFDQLTDCSDTNSRIALAMGWCNV